MRSRGFRRVGRVSTASWRRRSTFSAKSLRSRTAARSDSSSRVRSSGTASACRSALLVGCPCGLLPSYNRERLLLGEDYGPYNLVFATQVGTPLSVGLVTPTYKRALRRAGLPASIRFHDLRHAAATTMLANGVDVPTVAAILGHARNSTTLDVYAHAVPTRLAGGVEALQRALRAAPAGGY